MSTNRLEVLRSLVAQNPADSFARYGLAMELARAGKPEEAVEEFRQLLAANPDYAAGYFHGGQTLEKLGRVEEARALYERGIAATARTGDAHTQSELQAALDLLPI
jgi:tetratricopeptide (TPR) repeat protein